MKPFVKINLAGIITALLLAFYFFSLSLIQKQWAFYLSANALLGTVFAMGVIQSGLKGFWNFCFQVLLFVPVGLIGFYSRIQLNAFDNIEDADQYVREHTLFYIMSLLIPVVIAYLVKIFFFRGYEQNTNTLIQTFDPPKKL